MSLFTIKEFMVRIIFCKAGLIFSPFLSPPPKRYVIIGLYCMDIKGDGIVYKRTKKGKPLYPQAVMKTLFTKFKKIKFY